MRAPIHSQKHYVQVTLTSIATGTLSNSTFVRSVSTVDKNTNFEVEEGANVKAIFIEMWLIGTVTSQFFTLIFSKLPSSVAGATTGEIADLTSWPNKKNILFTSQGLASNDGNSAPIPVLRQWIKIPKGKQRMGLGDELMLQIMSRGSDTINICGFATYKEYT